MKLLGVKIKDQEKFDVRWIFKVFLFLLCIPSFIGFIIYRYIVISFKWSSEASNLAIKWMFAEDEKHNRDNR